jgi:hypothetical protein
MSTRQSDCEAEIVPSLHSKLAEASATGGGFDAMAGSVDFGFSATGLCGKAQSAQKSRISKAEAVRIALHPGPYAGGPHGGLHPTPAFQPVNSQNTDTTEQLDSDMPQLCGSPVRNIGIEAEMRSVSNSRSAGSVPAVRERDDVPDLMVIVGGVPRWTKRPRGKQQVFVLGRRNGCPHGIQQSFEFSFTHCALQLRERKVPKVLCSPIEAITQIVSIG